MVSGLSFCGPWLGSALLDATVFLKPASPRGAQDAGPQFPISPRGQHPPQLPVQMSQDPLPTGATSVFSTTPYTQSVMPGPWFSWNTQPHIRALISSPSARDSPRSPHSSQGCPLISASWQAFLSELTSPYPWAI